MFPIRNESKKTIDIHDQDSASAMNPGAVEKIQGSNQPAKLFDKRFVATTLRNTRCCPKCRSEYSTNHDLRMGDLHVKNNRPFLLTCGHNMCENCIYQYHQNLMCSVCQLPIVIKNRNTQRTLQKHQRNFQHRHENFNIHNFFYLNFFLIGELYHLRFFRRESSANNTLMIASGNDPPDLQLTPTDLLGRCNECESDLAMGYCRQCSMNYCRPCYDSIHMYAHVKVLKRHSFVTLDLTEKMKKFRHIYCQHHKRVKNRFCRTCQISCCSSCQYRDHQSHRLTNVGNENEGIQEEIATILELAKVSQETLRKSQKNVKAVELQFEDYATQCLTDISEYFLQLHSFLQNEEQKILEDFRTQCMQPQKTLRSVLYELSTYQVILNKMCSELQQYQHEVPTHIYLRDLFDIYNNQLEQIKCRAHISKLTKNPFVFEVKHDLRKDFTQLFTCNYEDPHIKILLASIYSSFPDTESDSTNEMDVDSYIDENKRENNERNKKKKKQHKTQGHIDNADDTSDMEIIEKQTLRDKELVRISHVESPEYFYVQTKNAISQIRDLSDKYVNFIQTDKIPKVITKGQCYMTYYVDDKQWYRAMVKKILPNDLYKVFLVDIGMNLEVAKERFCKIDPKALSIPFAAVPCAIHDIMPARKSWNKEANNLLIEITRNNFVCISIIERIKENLLSVDLIATFAEEKVSVRDSFLYTGLGRKRSGATNLSSPLKKISLAARTNQRLPKYSFHNGDMMFVKVISVENPNIFYVMKMDAFEEAQQLKADLNFKYSHTKLELQPLYVAPLQMCCAVRINDVWHRARIEEIYGDGKICVHLVDEGTQEAVVWRQIFPLANKFRTPNEFAIKCSLADVEPLQENNYAWTMEAIREFSQLTANPTVQMAVVSTSQATVHVTLHVCKKHVDRNVGAMLVKYGHCLATGESTQTVEVFKTSKTRLSLQINPFLKAIQVPNSKGRTMSLQPIKGEVLNAAASHKPVKLLKRTPVKVIHIVDPGEFYVQIASLATGIIKFHNQLQLSQEHDAERNESNTSSFSLCSQPSKKWFVGNHCLVYTKYKSGTTSKNTNASEWYRAIIISITTEMECETFTVFLRDIGATISGITVDQLRVIDAQWDRVSNAVHRCHLAFVVPTGGMTTWTHSAIDCFKHTVTSFESLSATLQGKRLPGSNSLPIVLWGTITETEDPLAPCITKHSIINRILVKAGLAHSVQRLVATEQLDKLLQMELVEDEITLDEWNKNFAANAALKEIDRCAQQKGKNAFNNDNFGNSLSEDDVKDNQLKPKTDFCLDFERDDFICGEPTIYTGQAPKAWLTPKTIDKSIFAAIPTYVDYDAVVYLHDANDESLLHRLRERIMKIYGELKLPTDFIPTYTTGQACLVRYHVDNQFYRGIIQESRKNAEYIVQFIDYGNVESVQTTELLPYAPFPKLPRIAHKYRIQGIYANTQDGAYTTAVLDIIHVTIVEKVVSVRVLSSELQNPVKLCNMRLGSIDVAQYLINTGHVLCDNSTKPRSKTKKEIYTSQPKNKELAPNQLTMDTDDTIDKALLNVKGDKMFQFKHIKSDFVEQQHYDKAESFTDEEDNEDDDCGNSDDDTVNECLDQLISNLKNDDGQSDSDESVNHELNAALSPMRAAQAAKLSTQQHQQSFLPPRKKRMFDSNEYKQMHKQMLQDNLYGSENFMENELAALQSDQMGGGAVGGSGSGAFGGNWGIGEDDEDAAIAELEQSFALHYWHTTEEEEREREKKEDKKMKKTKEEEIFLEKVKEKGIDLCDRESFALQPQQLLETSAFDRFYPDETSSVFSHFSGIECFKNPQLPVSNRTFECSVVFVITPTIVQILPHLTEFEYRELELQRRIKHLVKTAAPLSEFQPRTICLAQYHKDKRWYRALIRSHNPVAKQVDVFFVDYLNTETVPLTQLKQCPLELISWPLRTARARLHGLTPNPRLREKDIRQALQKIILKRTLVARIVRAPKSYDNPNATSMPDLMWPDNIGRPNPAAMADAFQPDLNDIMEVHLYNPDAEARKLRDARIYQPLIQDSFYSYKKA